MICYYHQHRGSDFRKEFSKHGDLRGFFPIRLRIMSLTATASTATRENVSRLLGMYDPVMIVRSPDKPNIRYTVIEKEQEMEEVFAPVVEELLKNRNESEKTIIFGQTYNDFNHLYLYFKDRLGKEMTDPIGFPDVARFRIVDMFTACNTSSIKMSILKNFCSNTSRLRIVIATVAFGLGIDCPNVHRIIHWGLPSDAESYIQETGRAGRDGHVANAILFYSRRDISYGYMDKSIVSYCRNKELCRRDVLFKDFGYTSEKPFGYMCCDICTILCKCSKCRF